MGKITIELKIYTFGNMLYGLNHPNKTYQYHMHRERTRDPTACRYVKPPFGPIDS